MDLLDSKYIQVAARSSPLSRAQVEEVLNEMRIHYPDIEFDCSFVQTTGDKDLLTSLKSMEKTDFFTKEVDALVLSGLCRAGIHSAKDLAQPLAQGLQLAALTRGVNPSDVLVLRNGESVFSLQKHARIGTSSLRREKNIKMLREDFVCVDIRGTIEQRLEKLDSGQVDGLIMAEAAIIRLNLTNRNRVLIPGDVAEGQGQLAVVIRENDEDTRKLFALIDARMYA